ncbi:MAG: inositol monophosphatase family protein [Vulcanimicrobiota bacterium]
MSRDYGTLAPSTVGVVMREAVRRAIKIIQRHRFVVEAEAKMGKDGVLNDVVTVADREAQEMYLRMIRENFPHYGVLAEEDELRIPGGGLYLTVDPLDGTRAYARRQSTGVGTMIALSDGREVISAYVGDALTSEVYGYRPDSERVYRLNRFEQAIRIWYEAKPLKDSYILLREDPWTYRLDARTLATQYFRGIDVEGGSIGLSFARLWKREVGAILLGPGFDTPWDSTPVQGISKKLGFVSLEVRPNGQVEMVDPLPPCSVAPREAEVLIVHRDNLAELDLAHPLFRGSQ